MLRSLRIRNLVLIDEAELDLAAGLNAITGETGAGKTILAQAIGLLLGAKGDAAAVGPHGTEAYVEAELDLPDDALDDEALAALVEVRPDGEEGLTLARRVFADGRTRAYAWGRAVAREDLAAAAERHDRDVGSVRAAAARPARLPAGRARRVLRRGAARPPPAGAGGVAGGRRGAGATGTS